MILQKQSSANCNTIIFPSARDVYFLTDSADYAENAEIKNKRKKVLFSSALSAKSARDTFSSAKDFYKQLTVNFVKNKSSYMKPCNFILLVRFYAAAHCYIFLICIWFSAPAGISYSWR